MLHNKINQKILRLGVVLMLVAAVSCNKLLEEKPHAIDVDNFYQTIQDADAATAAIYGPLHPDTAYLYYEIISDCLADFLIPNNSWLPLNNYTQLDATNRSRTENVWKTFYLSIRNANLVVKNIPASAVMDDSTKARYIGEAKFMRAIIYFQLVRNWGGLPLRTEANMLQPDLKRTSADSVYLFIESDLQYAEAHLPDNQTQVGRPTKWAAKAVLADVYLQVKNNQSAMDKANEVMQSGLFSLVDVQQPDDFLNVFGPELVSTKEEIFYFKFTRQTAQGNGMTLYEAHPNTPYANGSGFFSFYTDPTKINAFKTWDVKDLRRQYGAYPYQFGRGDSTYLIKKFQDKQAITNGYGGNDYPWYGYPDILMIYAEAANEINNGPTEDAIEALNKIHRRAYGFASTAASPVDFKISDYNKSTFLSLVVKERGYETLLEGKRWMELKRLSILKDYILNSKGKTVQDVAMLWPIPNTELNYNKALDPVKDQNPGY